MTAHLDEDRLQALVDGETASESEEAHLASCPECGRALGAFRALGEVLSTLHPAPVPSGFAPTIMARIDERRLTVRRQLAVALGAPLAALVALGAVVHDQAILSITSDARAIVGAMGIAARIARILTPIVKAYGPYLAFAVVALTVLSLPLLRHVLEVSMRSRAKHATTAVLSLLLLLPAGFASAQDAGPARSDRLLGDWPAEERDIDLALTDAPPQEALQKLGEAAGWNVVVPSLVGPTVTVRLDDVRADDALASLLEQWGARARRKGTLVTIVREERAPGAETTAPLAAPPPPPAPPPAPPAPDEDLVDRVATGTDVVVGEGERVADAVATGGDVIVRGEVMGDAVATGGSVRVERTGHVHGDAVTVGGSLEVAEGGRIDGDRVQVGIGAVGKAIFGGGASSHHREPGGIKGFLGDVFGTLARGVAFFVLALLLAIFAKDRINVVTEEIRKRPLHSFGSGLLAAIALPVLTVLLCIVVVGIPVVPFLWLGAVLAVFAGMTSIALMVGEKLPLLERRKTQIICLALGAALLTVLDFIPVVGTIVLVVASLVALGAVVRTRFAKPNGHPPPATNGFAYRSPA